MQDRDTLIGGLQKHIRGAVGDDQFFDGQLDVVKWWTGLCGGSRGLGLRGVAVEEPGDLIMPSAQSMNEQGWQARSDGHSVIWSQSRRSASMLSLLSATLPHSSGRQVPWTG